MKERPIIVNGEMVTTLTIDKRCATSIKNWILKHI